MELFLSSCVRFGFNETYSSNPDMAHADASRVDIISSDMARDQGQKDRGVLDGMVNDISQRQDHFFDGNPQNDLPQGSDSGPGLDRRAFDAKVSLPGAWVTIKAGTFSMGSPEDELCRETNETSHQVTLTHDFEIQTTEVTTEQWNRIFPDLPITPGSCGSNCPSMRNWDFSAYYCNRLATQSGLDPCYDCKWIEVDIMCQSDKKQFVCDELPAYQDGDIYKCPGYRLPTEAEWEYAYRAGTTTPLYNGSISECLGSDPNADAIAWYGSNSKSQVNPSGQKTPNTWKLYDMAGNMLEWVNDLYQPDLGSASVNDPGGPKTVDLIPPCNRPGRVLKGGSWLSGPGQLRAAARNFAYSTFPNETNGFRCVRTLFK